MSVKNSETLFSLTFIGSGDANKSSLKRVLWSMKTRDLLLAALATPPLAFVLMGLLNIVLFHNRNFYSNIFYVAEYVLLAMFINAGWQYLTSRSSAFRQILGTWGISMALSIATGFVLLILVFFILAFGGFFTR